MTGAEAIRKAVTENDAKLAGRISDDMRSRGIRYSGVFASFNRVTGIDAADFDALMYEADTISSRE